MLCLMKAQSEALALVTRRFAEQLTALRTDRRETQRQLAARLGMTESMISRLESGSHAPGISTLCRIADGFDLQLEIGLHEHEHVHEDGIRHAHAHRHDPEQLAQSEHKARPHPHNHEKTR